jgi:hypothetical protein
MSEEEILELRPELKAAASFVANHLVQNPSATINDVQAAWDNQRGDSLTQSITLDGKLGRGPRGIKILVFPWILHEKKDD